MRSQLVRCWWKAEQIARFDHFICVSYALKDGYGREFMADKKTYP